MSRDQDAVFRTGEGDAWLARNRAHLETYAMDADPLARALAWAGLRPRRILDLGCSLGTRLSTWCDGFPAEGCGVDPSAGAIAAAAARDPARRWQVGTVDQPGALPWRADLVVLSFVLHWIDRDRLLAALAAIDAALEPGGHVLIHDFWPERPERRAYHHLPGAGVFTWKADYPAMLEATGLYQPVQRQALAYPGWGPAAAGDVRSLLALLRRRRADEIPEV